MSHLDLWTTACKALEEVSNYSPEEHDRYMRSATLLPPMISLGDGQQVFTTQAGVNAIARLGEAWRTEDPDRRARVTAERMNRLALAEFGEMLAENKLEICDDAAAALKAFKRRLGARLAAAYCEAHHYFPCRIVDADSAPSFAIGRVRFVRPAQWLDGVREVAERGLAWTKRVQAHWQGVALAPPDKSMDRILAEMAIEAIGACKWVATVSVSGNDIGRSAERARFGVRLALDGLGVVMTSKQALNLRGPGDDIDPGITTHLSQAPGEDVTFDSRRDLPLLLTHEPHASTFIKESEELREAIGWAIEGVFRLPGEVDLYDLRRRWCDALFWFGEARRDDTASAAIIRYGMCLDVLANGGAAPEIIKMVATLFGRDTKAGLLSDGTSVQSAIEKLYNRGRSQIGHGGAPALLEDTPIDRGAADNICRRALNRYLSALRDYKGADDPTDFLSSLAMPATAAGVEA
jgi:hypothetical protein